MPDTKWLIEPFDRRRHDRSEFNCGAQVLNDWLTTQVSQYERRDLARTYVLVKEGTSSVKGYYTLSNHAVAYEALAEEEARGLPRIDVPLVLIGRLAVDLSVQGQRLGEFLLLNALKRAEFLATRIGIQAVEVHALDEAAQRFYERFGFVALVNAPRHLYLPVKVIRKLKLPPL